MKKKDKKFISFVLLHIVILFFVFGVQKSFCFSISPNIVEVILAPEEDYKGEFSVNNEGPDKVKVKISAEGFWTSDESIRKSGQIPKEWVSILPMEIEIPSNESRICQFEIKLPKNASGEYRAEIFFQDITQGEDAKQGLNIKVRYGHTVYAVVKDTEIVKGEIRGIQLAGSKPGRFWVRVYNSGNVHTRPKGQLNVRNTKTNMEITIPFNPARIPALPYEEAEVLAKGDVDLEPGTYLVTAMIKYGEEYGEKAIRLAKKGIFKIE